MIIQQSIAQLKQLKLHGMAKNIQEQRASTAAQKLSFEERLGLSIDAELSDRESRRLDRLLYAAKLKVSASIEAIEYSGHRGLDRQVVADLASCDWIDQSLNTIITGPTGVGKTWLACAFGNQAARKGHSVLYKRLSRLLEELEIAYGDGTLSKLRAKLAKIDLIILDDWALAPLTTRGRHELLELIDDHINNGSILIASQLPVDQWHEFIGDPTIADAILDRLVHRAHRIELRGDSMRKVQRSPSAQEDKA